MQTRKGHMIRVYGPVGIREFIRTQIRLTAVKSKTTVQIIELEKRPNPNQSQVTSNNNSNSSSSSSNSASASNPSSIPFFAKPNSKSSSSSANNSDTNTTSSTTQQQPQSVISMIPDPSDYSPYNRGNATTAISATQDYSDRTAYKDANTGVYHLYEDQFITVKAMQIAHNVTCYGYVVEEKQKPGTLNAVKLQADGLPPGNMYKEIKNGKNVTYKGKLVSNNCNNWFENCVFFC